MLHVIVSFESGAEVKAPFGPYKLREEVEFERQFGVSSAVLQRYGDVAQRRLEWMAENPEPDEKAPASDKRAWAARAEAFADELRDLAPPQEHMLFMAWLRARKADATLTPSTFDGFLDEVARLEYVSDEPEAPANGNGAAPADDRQFLEQEEPSSGPTSPVAP